MWFCTRAEGIYRFDGKTLVNYMPNNEDWFKAIFEDKDGNIWIGRRYKGVYRYDGKTFAKVLQNGLFDECTTAQIMQDKKGNLWFATEAGEESKRETEGGIWRYNGKVFENVSKKDDLKHDGTWCILEDKLGNFWIGDWNKRHRFVPLRWPSFYPFFGIRNTPSKRGRLIIMLVIIIGNFGGGCYPYVWL